MLGLGIGLTNPRHKKPQLGIFQRLQTDGKPRTMYELDPQWVVAVQRTLGWGCPLASGTEPDVLNFYVYKHMYK
jgi:hypothetical protein